MKKQLPAVIAAFLITAFMTLAMSVVGVSAMFNKNSTPVANTAISADSPEQAQIAQLQDLVNQYQQREQEYQQREQQYQQREQQLTDQANQVSQQLQQLLFVLQSRGLIAVQGDGRIVITGRPGN